jgi:hypothetical protein
MGKGEKDSIESDSLLNYFNIHNVDMKCTY